ncbi:MAG: tetratricopeptide repeat protein [Elusimicrobiota bacterium]|jgi:tetratricopeptide (TPR) repeat protein|nr:tetratricopeptide repeat protein [Elusimicrobiota bacterium]
MKKSAAIFCVLFFAAASLQAQDVFAPIELAPTSTLTPNATPSVSKSNNTQTQQAYIALDNTFYQKFITAAWYETNNMPAEAFAIYEELNKKLPNNPSILKSLVDIAVNSENLKAMQTYIPQLAAVEPNSANTYAMLAALHWSKGELKEAAAAYQKAIAKNPNNPQIIFKYVVLLTSMDSDKAIEYLRSLSNVYPRMSGIIALQVAELYLRDNNPTAAVKYLKEAIKKHPTMVEPYLALVKIYENEGNTNAALKEYLAMEQAGLASSDILVKIGSYYVLKEDRAKANEYFLKAKALDNTNAQAAQFLSLYAQDRGDYAEAIQYLQASKTYQDTPASWLRVSYLYSRLNQPQMAADTLAKAYSKFAGNIEVAYYYSLSLIDLQNYKKAAAVLKEVLKTAPNNAPSLLQYAFVLERLKKYKEMQNILLKVLELEPNNSGALNFLGYYLVDKTKKLEEGGDYIKKAVSLSPNTAAFIDSLAWYYYKKGEVEKALNLLLGLPSEELSDPEITMHLAAVYEELKNYKEAVSYYNKTLEIEPKNKQAQKAKKRVEKLISKQNKQAARQTP